MKAKILIGALGLTAIVGAGAAFADRRCEARVSDWQPRSAVVQMAESKGWQVERIRVDDGCYALRVTDAQGRGMKVLVDPTTLAVVATKMRGDGHGEGRGRRWRGGDDERGGWFRGGDDDRRERRGERRRDHDDDDDDDRGAARQGRAPQPLGSSDGAAPGAAAPATAQPPAADPAGDGALIGKPKATIR